MSLAPYSVAYVQDLYAFRKSYAPLPQVTSAMVEVNKPVQVVDSTWGAGCFSVQLNLNGKKYWSQVTVSKVRADIVNLVMQQYLNGSSTSSPPVFNYSVGAPSLPMNAGAVYSFSIKDDGAALWGLATLNDGSKTVFDSGWVKFGVYDNIMDATLAVCGAFSASRATFTDADFSVFLQTNGIDCPDLTSFRQYWTATSPFGQPIPPYYIKSGNIPPQQADPYLAEQTGESSNLILQVTNSNEITPDVPLAGYLAWRAFTPNG